MATSATYHRARGEICQEGNTRLALVEQGDRTRRPGQAGGKVERTVDRIDDPLPGPGSGDLTTFLAQDGVAGKPLGNSSHQVALDVLIRRRGQVEFVALGLDGHARLTADF